MGLGSRCVRYDLLMTNTKSSEEQTQGANPPTRRGQKVQAAETGLEVLKALGDLGGSASLSALAAKLNEHPAKVHRYLGSLVSAGFVYQRPESTHYVLGVEALTLGLAAQRQQSALLVTEPLITTLCEKLKVTVAVAVMGNRGPVIVRWEEPLQPIVVNVRVGFVMPLLSSATGLAFAAFSSDDQLSVLIDRESRQTPEESRRELPALDSIEKSLEEFRVAGCTWVADTLLRGASGMAAPVFNHKGRVEAVVSLLGVSGAFNITPDGPNGSALLQATTTASRQLGYQCHPRAPG